MKKERSIAAGGLTKKICCGVVAAAMALSLVGASSVTAKAEDTQTAISLSNPRIVKDPDYQSGKKVTYDCVYFGSYPQAEVVASVEDETTVYEPIRKESDYVVDAELYDKLQSATGWDANGDVTIDGEKYRRMTYKDATHYEDVDPWGYDVVYDWGKLSDGSMDESYHYFKYQPIKWRVLSVDDSIAFLLADVVIDYQRYNIVEKVKEDSETTDTEDDDETTDTEEESVTWETSTIRSFLNSYGASNNQENIDYSDSGFLKAAFTDEEMDAIANDTVINNDHIYMLYPNKFFATEGGNNTTDRIFLLSDYEAYGGLGAAYGFIDAFDEAKRAKSSTYAKAMGGISAMLAREDKGVDNVITGYTSYAGNYGWWLRSPGYTTDKALSANCFGTVVDEGWYVYSHNGVRPALKFNLSYTSLLTSAGTYTTVTDRLKDVATDTDAPTDTDTPTNTDTPTEHSHNYTSKVTKPATCTVEGVTTYTCACGASYTKAISKTPHTNSDWTVTKKATASADGQKVVKCTTCGTVLMTEKIAKPASVSLSTSQFAYDGKVKTPAVTVRDSAGMDISASDYSVSYRNNKNPGTATVTVTFKGSAYAGTLTGKFTITKAKQTIKTAKLKTYKAKSLKTKKAVVNLKAKATGKGKLTYKVSKYPRNGKKYISVSKKGVVTLKKGAKKGIYKITITAAATGTYAKATKTVTIKVK